MKICFIGNGYLTFQGKQTGWPKYQTDAAAVDFFQPSIMGLRAGELLPGRRMSCGGGTVKIHLQARSAYLREVILPLLDLFNDTSSQKTARIRAGSSARNGCLRSPPSLTATKSPTSSALRAPLRAASLLVSSMAMGRAM